MKKIVAAVVCVITVVAVFLFFNGGKKQIIGTWYYEKNPNKSITIYENNEIVGKGVGLGTEIYDYTYKEHVLTLYLYGFKEHAYVVKVRGDKMYLTEGDDTDVYYRYYEEEKEIEDEIPLDTTTSQSEQDIDWDYFDRQNKMYIATDRIDVEGYLKENGYYDFTYEYKEEYLDLEDFPEGMYYPTIIYTYSIWEDIYCTYVSADIEYNYINDEWMVSEYGIVFDAVPLA